MVLPILKFGAPELKKPTATVDFFNGELEKIVRSLVDTMYAAPGIGLAANQVGIDLKLTTMDLSGGEEPGKLIAVCNPRIVMIEGEQRSEEGCLSIPDFTETITRPKKLILEGVDIHGEEIKIEAEGLMARCICHEIDHLNGVLFIEHLSVLKRNLIRNKIKKLIKAGEW
jgi:peptide deformylase